MSNYYPEHVYFQSQSSSSAAAQSTSSLRRCSVKGCGKDLPQDYALKMCDDCRGRHRKYATTKRAKRKQEKAAVGAQRGSDDGRVVTWMPPDHHVSLGPFSDDLDPVTNMHVSQIDPRLFNPTSSELAGALTLPPLDSNIDSQGAYNPTSAQTEETGPALSAARSATALPRYCSVKGCRTVIGGDYLYKMCVPCRNRYRGYGMTKRSKWKRGREIAAQELDRLRVEEDARRASQGLPLISQLQASDRRAWEREVSETIPQPPVVQYTPITILPVRMCTVSHCHTVLQGHYPYRRCERHRLQNRHHSKLKRVRDKEVKSTPLRRERTRDPGSLGSGSRKGKARAIEPLYTNEPLNLDPHDLETDEAVSETDEMPDESSIPPPARGARRSNTVCSVKWCHNVLDYRSPWKMCEAHREKDRKNRKRKSARDTIACDVDDEVAGQIVGHASMATDVVESIAEPSSLALETSTPASAHPVIFMEPLLPPAETLPTIMLQQTEMSEYAIVPPRGSPLLSYECAISDANVVVDTADPCEADIETSSQQSITEEASAGGPCLGNQEVSAQLHGQQDIPSVVWRSAVSPVSSTGDSDSSSSDSALSSEASSEVTMGESTASSPSASTVSSTAGSAGSSTGTAHIHPQFQVPYYMPPPFSVPYTPGQPPFLIPGPYSAMPYHLRPSFTYGTPASSPFQGYQYAPAPPPSGQLAPYALRPYPYAPWAPYANGSIDANWFDPSSQAHVQTQVQTKSQRPKRGWVADQLAPGEDGLRIVMVQPKGFNDIDVAASPASSVTSTSASESRPTRPIPEPSISCSPQSSTDGPQHAEASSASWPATAADSAPARSCSSESCRRLIPAEVFGTLCLRCKIRLKRRLEQTKRRLKLEPKKTRSQSHTPSRGSAQQRKA